MKKTILILIGILLVSTVIAYTIANADFIVPEKEIRILYEGEITFLADGEPEVCYVTSGDENYDDDFEACLNYYFAGKRIINARDWAGRDYKQVEIKGTIYRSFDESKLQAEIDKQEELDKK